VVSARPAALDRLSDRSFFVFNGVVSVIALSFIAYILVLREGGGLGDVDLRFLPAVNASLNATSAVLLAVGWVAIRRRAVRLHKRLMVSAFAASTVFLVCYLVYHYAHGDTKYQGDGWLRVVYFAVLISHVLLSMLVVPMALSAFYFAWRRQFDRHRRLTRFALPIWLYVSVTGVVIYWMLRASSAAVHL
jgi:putative membrane protein